MKDKTSERALLSFVKLAEATMTLENPNGEFSYAVNHLWHGTRVRLVEGVLLPDGEEFLLPQGGSRS